MAWRDRLPRAAPVSGCLSQGLASGIKLTDIRSPDDKMP